MDCSLSVSDIDCNGKPSPDIYLNLSKMMGISPQACLAIEDSKPGVTATISAGMRVLGFRNGFNEGQDLSETPLGLYGFRGVQFEDLRDFYNREW
ncbi:MAG: HAD-IA family hydrolase [Verrucomicrobiota bacterium]